MQNANLSRPLGNRIPDWQPPVPPGPAVIAGRYVRLERLDPRNHAAGIFAATRGDDSVWDYMNNGPFSDEGELRDWMVAACAGDDVFYAFVDAGTGRIFGYAAFIRVNAGNGVLEIGHVVIGPAAQRSRMTSEALMSMIAWAFGAGYRRVEWKCNMLNAPSRRAARRYGFVFEGVFRNHMVSKGRNRDTAWYSITLEDWQGLAPAHAQWLEPENFDDSGRQRTGLSALTSPVVVRAEARLLAGL